MLHFYQAVDHALSEIWAAAIELGSLYYFLLIFAFVSTFFHIGAVMNACDFAVLGMGVSTSLAW